MRRDHVSAIIALTVLCAVPARAQDANQRLFSLFKTYCVETGTMPDAVRAAVETEGDGLTRRPLSPAQGRGNAQLGIWDFNIEGRLLSLSADSRRTGPNSDTFRCTILEHDQDDAGVVALRQWAGLPPVSITEEEGQPSTFHYKFVSLDGLHFPLPRDKDALDAAYAAGNIWTLDISESDTKVQVRLSLTLRRKDPSPDDADRGEPGR